MMYHQIFLATNGIQEFIEFILWPILIVSVVVAFILGGFVTKGARWILRKIGSLLPLHCNKRWVDCIIKGILVIVALIAGNAFHLELSQVVDTIIPIGDFNSIAEEFAANPDKWTINVVFNVLLNQFGLSLAYFIPFFGFELLVRLVETLICDEDAPDGILGSLISFVVDIAALLSVNTIVLCTGMTFPQIMYEYLKTIDSTRDVGQWVFLVVIFVAITFFVVRDLFSSDILLAILGVNAAAAFFEIGVTDQNRWILFGASILCGLLAKLLRGKIVPEDHEESDKRSVWFGIGTLVGTCLIVFGVLWLLHKYAPGLSLHSGLI
ncbi:MAG: hypothetical protein IJ281_08205 [Clostridia bacterium]|nr:hypothetical protein [Clostridia bacterium]